MTGDRIFKTGVGVCVCIIHYNTFILLMRERERGEGRITQLLLHTYNSQLNETSRLCLCSPLFFCSPPNFCLSKHRPSNWRIKQRSEIKRQKFFRSLWQRGTLHPPPQISKFREVITPEKGEMCRRTPVRLWDEVLYTVLDTMPELIGTTQGHSRCYSGYSRQRDSRSSKAKPKVKNPSCLSNGKRQNSGMFHNMWLHRNIRWTNKVNMWAINLYIYTQYIHIFICHMSRNVIKLWKM